MVTLKEIELAHDRIRSFIHRTPILTNKSLNELSGASLYFKCENFQKVGAFKIRGATNTVEQLSLHDALPICGTAFSSRNRERCGNHILRESWCSIVYGSDKKRGKNQSGNAQQYTED